MPAAKSLDHGASAPAKANPFARTAGSRSLLDEHLELQLSQSALALRFWFWSVNDVSLNRHPSLSFVQA